MDSTHIPTTEEQICSKDLVNQLVMNDWRLNDKIQIHGSYALDLNCDYVECTDKIERGKIPLVFTPQGNMNNYAEQITGLSFDENMSCLTVYGDSISDTDSWIEEFTSFVVSNKGWIRNTCTISEDDCLLSNVRPPPPEYVTLNHKNDLRGTLILINGNQHGLKRRNEAVLLRETTVIERDLARTLNLCMSQRAIMVEIQ